MNSITLTPHDNGTFTFDAQYRLGESLQVRITHLQPLENSNLPVLELQARACDAAALALQAFAQSLRSNAGAKPGA